MAYADVDTAFRAVRADGDRRGRVEVAFLRKAITRLGAIAANDDQREYAIARAVVDGTVPDTWIKLVFGLLDQANQLAAPTDAQLNTQVDTAWTKLATAR